MLEHLPLDERKRTILKLVVHDYVRTAEPVGSEMLVSRHRLSVKPATIRNEMAEMSSLGYLRQPHTSSGRVPSEQGYRFYVDQLMPQSTLPTRQQKAAQSAYHDLEADLERILVETCRVLSRLTSYASVAIQTSTDRVEIRHVSLTRVADDKLLLVVVFSDGRVEHRIVLAAAGSHPNRVSTALNASFSGRTVEEVCAGSEVEPPAEVAAYSALFQAAAAQVRHVARTVLEGDIYIDGANYILRQPEFRDVKKAEEVLAALDQRKGLFEILSRALLGPDTSIVIGSESPCVEMQECSFVARRYSIGGRPAGTIGVVGPTRMDYRRACAAVRFMAQNLTDLLTSLSIG